MRTSGLVLEPGRFILTETDYLHYLKRELGPEGEDLLAYFAPETGRVCIALWLDRDAGRVVEIMSYDNEHKIHPGKLDFVRWFLSPERALGNTEFGERMRSKARANRRIADDRNREARERRKFEVSRLSATKRDNPFNAVRPVGGV